MARATLCADRRRSRRPGPDFNGAAQRVANDSFPMGCRAPYSGGLFSVEVKGMATMRIRTLFAAIGTSLSLGSALAAPSQPVPVAVERISVKSRAPGRTSS